MSLGNDTGSMVYIVYKGESTSVKGNEKYTASLFFQLLGVSLSHTTAAGMNLILRRGRQEEDPHGECEGGTT